MSTLFGIPLWCPLPFQISFSPNRFHSRSKLNGFRCVVVVEYHKVVAIKCATVDMARVLIIMVHEQQHGPFELSSCSYPWTRPTGSFENGLDTKRWSVGWIDLLRGFGHLVGEWWSSEDSAISNGSIIGSRCIVSSAAGGVSHALYTRSCHMIKTLISFSWIKELVHVLHVIQTHESNVDWVHCYDLQWEHKWFFDSPLSHTQELNTWLTLNPHTFWCCEAIKYKSIITTHIKESTNNKT